MHTGPESTTRESNYQNLILREDSLVETENNEGPFTTRLSLGLYLACSLLAGRLTEVAACQADAQSSIRPAAIEH